MRRLAVLVSLALIGSACGSSESEPEVQPEPPSAATSTTTAPSTTTEPVAAPPTETGRKAAKPPPGIPGFAAGYRGWVRLNDHPIPPRDADPHNGTKNVFVSRRVGADALFPAGTIVVKEAVRPGADFIGLIATMRKRPGADPEHNDWVFVEYTRATPGARFTETASGQICWTCHMGAQSTDYVFTLGG
jgi:cytochrome P460